jgi:hypothetical protein
MDSDIRAIKSYATQEAQTIGASLRQPLNSAVAKERVAIDHEMSMLHQALERAHSLVSNLEARVSPVSQQVPPSDIASQTHEAVGNSRVYSELHTAATAVHVLEERIASVLRNLEV